MVRGKALSADLRLAVLNMARHWDVPNIVKFTGCKTRTVERILSDYRRKGTVLQDRHAGALQGLKKKLTTHDIRFLRGTVRHTADLYLDELRDLLEERCGTKVHESTVWRALRRSGFTIKKVSSGYSCFFCSNWMTDKFSSH
ncbi:Homeodomain-like protein [Hygrophoropsis aurantiaca]|uniref:Homeodomain-like protein n=1 Tax=Hygrophoropsis aurantiaca TaxID=72124 RepID=A0ACB7ZRC5_9AGAM|nr:Homeodomain-like protein [Hygrophoropsis aurantiaca]